MAPPIKADDPRQIGERAVTIRAPAKLPYLIMGYKVPVRKGAATKWEPYALEVLAGILDGGDSARLPSRLIRGGQTASEASAGYDLYGRLPGMFVFSGTPASGKDIEALQRAFNEQVDQLKATPVSDEELARVKAQVIAENIYGRDSVFYQAMQIGMLETVGLDWREIDRYVEHINEITPRQLLEVASKYFVTDHLTTAILDPLPIQSPSRRHMMPSGPVR